MFWTLLSKLLLHLGRKHLYQLKPLFDFKGTVYLWSMYNVLSYRVVEGFTHVRSISQSSQHCQPISHLGGWLCEVLDDITDLCDIVREDQTSNQYDKSEYNSLINVANHNISESHCRHYACRPVNTVEILRPPHLVRYAILIHPIFLGLNQSNN